MAHKHCRDSLRGPPWNRCSLLASLGARPGDTQGCGTGAGSSAPPRDRTSPPAPGALKAPAGDCTRMPPPTAGEACSEGCCPAVAVRSGRGSSCFLRLTVQTPVVVFLVCGDGIILLHKNHLCYPRVDQPSPLQGSTHTEKLLPSRGAGVRGEVQAIILPATHTLRGLWVDWWPHYG